MRMKKIAATILVVALLSGIPAFGASDNSIDRHLSVKDNYTFAPGSAFSTLRIEESGANDFSTTPSTITITLNHASWSDASLIQGDVVTDGLTGSTVQIVRVSDHDLSVTLTRGVGSPTTKAWWRIPIYAEVKEAGDLTVQVDGRDSYVSSGTYSYAQSIGDAGSGSVAVGHRYSAADALWATVREPQANALAAGPQTLGLVLTNAVWLGDSDPSSGSGAIFKDSVSSGVEGAKVISVTKVSDTELDVVVDRGKNGSAKGIAAWSLPIYCQVTGVGDVKLDFKPLNSVITQGQVTTTKIMDPIRTRTQLGLTLNSPSLSIQKNGVQTSATLVASPLNLSGSTLVPVRGIYENLGAQVLWKETSRTVEIHQDGQNLVLSPDRRTVFVNGKAVDLPEPARIIQGRLYLPLRAISEQLGLTVEWDAATQHITLIQD